MVRLRVCWSVVSLLIVVAVVVVELAQRRIPVQFAKRVVGRRMYGGQNTYIPLKVNQSGVVPIIFASSVLLLPVLLTNFLGGSDGTGWRATSRSGSTPTSSTARTSSTSAVLAADRRLRLLLQLDRVRPDPPGRPDPTPGWLHPRHPSRTADRALPGQGRQPDHAARRGLRRRHRHHCRTSSSGCSTCRTSRSPAPPCLIAVGVALELMRQIDSQLMLRNYEGFLK